MRTGVFGGSFDPPHIGHLVVAENARAFLGLDRVIWIPAARAPQKPGGPSVDSLYRLRMVQLAIADNNSFCLNDLEVRRGGVSYTVETLRELNRRNPDSELFLLMGMDAFRDFGSWRAPNSILELATLAVYPRNESSMVPGQFRATMIDSPRIDVSSTMIRERVATGRPIRYLVPDPVWKYIERNGLYTTDRLDA